MATPDAIVPCPSEDELLAHVEGTAVDSARSRIESHLPRCALCRETVAALVRMARSVGSETEDLRRALAVAYLQPGDRVSRYRIRSVIGEGAMGVVYAAHDKQLDRRVAIKVLRSGGAELDRLRREARALARIAHPNVVEVYEVGEHGALMFVCMEFVAGQTLSAWAAKAPSRQALIDVFVQAGRALGAAHEAGLVHRDFKPENVLVGDDGRVRVADFGLVRAATDAHRGSGAPSGLELSDQALVTLTEDGALVGTPAYMAPEQLEGRPVDARADQFAFCVALYEAVHGERPFPGKTLGALLENITAQRFRKRSAGIEIPARLGRVIARGLARDPGARWPSMTRLVAALETVRRPRSVVGFAAPAVALGAGALVVAAALQRPESNACVGAADQLTGVWGLDQRAAVGDAFAKSDVGYADDTLARVQAHLDHFARDWTAAHAEACEATRARDEGVQRRGHLQLTCLQRQRSALAAAVEVLRDADASVVQRALTVAEGLEPATSCVDGSRDALATPEDPAARAATEEVRGALLQARALGLAGKYPEAVRAVEAVLTQAAETGFDPLIAEVDLDYGQALQADGAFVEAEAALRRAYFAAVSRGDRRRAASAATSLAHVVGVSLHRPDDGMQWVEHAAAEIAATSDERRTPELDHYRAMIDSRAARYEEALVAARRSLEAGKRLGEAPRRIARRTQIVGTILSRMGRFAEADAALRETLRLTEEAVGPEHPNVSEVLDNLAASAYQMGDPAGARALFERALAIKRRAFGPMHRTIARSLVGLGAIADVIGDPDGALGYFEEALAIQVETLGADHPDTAETHNNMGIALARLGRVDQGLEHLYQSLAIAERALGDDHPDVVSALLSIGQTLSTAGRIADASGYFERAAALAESLPPERPEVGSALISVASSRVENGRAASAIAPAQQAVQLSASAVPPTRAMAAAVLAAALWQSGADRHRALELADEARAIIATLPGAATRADVEDWLAKYVTRRGRR